MSKVERLFHLHNILDQRRTPISRHDLMERLECSQATLYRLIAELRDFLGAPIEQDEENRGFYYDRSYEQPFDLPGIWISPGELQALLTARQVLGNVQPGLLEGELRSLQGRITSLLQKKGVEPEGGESRIHIQNVAGRAVPARMFQDVLGALVQRRRLKIRYHGRRRDEESERAISPQRLTQHRNSWYLDAWCHKAQGLRSFALERIREQTLMEKDAKEVTKAALTKHFDRSYGIFSGPAEHTAQLRFSPEMARWVAEETWHPDQQGAFDKEGSWNLKVPFSGARELIMDILRYGAEVEVLAPGFLREAVAEEARKTAQAYR
ncbi:MAG: transcriptional regulator [Xanthomonadales bacterium]|nr:transcriptional regulator [Gammaproteobacteria bacterium]MBT8056036.1 transcriptional regulator [Gammaproteobacteria bacterium]NNJ79011.1 transcriptional regulator [Xanthomonadales bacterium]NNL04042.1 transcriptional regulator [Xanthomonadales bacterium]